MVKDLSCFLNNRCSDDIIVVDTEDGRIDENISALVLTKDHSPDAPSDA
jgi:hypothetical protein